MKYKYWIIGYGKFGSISLKRISAAKDKILIVDTDISDNDPAQSSGVSIVNSRGAEYLLKNMKENGPLPDFIIPAVPIHLAMHWILLRIKELKKKVDILSVPETIVSMLPNPITGNDNAIFTSHATWRCPDDCAEPADICTHTGLARPKNLFEIIEEITSPGIETVVIRSRQLAPGVGGYRPKILFESLNRILSHPGSYLIATACRCHGVIHLLKWE